MAGLKRFIIARNYRGAETYADHMGWPRDEWVYIYDPEHLKLVRYECKLVLLPCWRRSAILLVDTDKLVERELDRLNHLGKVIKITEEELRNEYSRKGSKYNKSNT